MNTAKWVVVAAVGSMALGLAPRALAQPEQSSGNPPNTSMTCRFQSGPLAGQIRDFSGTPGAKPFAAGAPCTDGRDSFGVAIEDKTTPAPSANRAGADSAAREPSDEPPTCHFKVGPRTGESMDLRLLPKSARRPGAACTDGKGSRGVVH
jgi:hypothetical protein